MNRVKRWTIIDYTLLYIDICNTLYSTKKKLILLLGYIFSKCYLPIFCNTMVWEIKNDMVCQFNCFLLLTIPLSSQLCSVMSSGVRMIQTLSEQQLTSSGYGPVLSNAQVSWKHKSETCSLSNMVRDEWWRENGGCSSVQLPLHHISPTGLDAEGLYRKSGEKRAIRSLEQAFNQDARGVYINPENYTVHDVTGCLKQFFRSLPDPLLTHNLYRNFLDASRECCCIETV